MTDALGKSFKPAQVRFTTALPKTRSAKVLRRAIRSIVTGSEPGDMSGLEDPAALDAIAMQAIAEHDGMTLELIGTNVMLRPLRTDDWDAWREVRVRCRDWLEQWEPRPEVGSADPALDREAFRARCGAWDRQRHFDAAYGFGLFQIDGRFAGEVSLGSVQRGPFQMGYVGYWVDEQLAGRGYVPEGVVLIMRYTFDVLQLHRLEAAIVPRNAPSRRVAEKLGLRDEGTAERFLQIQGEYEDHVRYRSPPRSGRHGVTNSWPASSIADRAPVVLVGDERRHPTATRLAQVPARLRCPAVACRRRSAPLHDGRRGGSGLGAASGRRTGFGVRGLPGLGRSIGASENAPSKPESSARACSYRSSTRARTSGSSSSCATTGGRDGPGGGVRRPARGRAPAPRSRVRVGLADVGSRLRVLPARRTGRG